MEIKIQTLTPLWTGGVDGKCDRLYETGILGSLRWWMEVLVRGVGGEVCDSTAEGDRNSLDMKKYRESKATDQRQKLRDGGLTCDVSHIFGATGWKRQFRLSITDVQETLKWDKPLKITPQDRTRGWFLNPGWLGEFTLNFHGNSNTLAKLYTLLKFLEVYGSLGARPQLGYGAFRIINIKNVPHIEASCFDYPRSDQTKITEFPDLRTFTFFKLRFTPKNLNWWHTVPGIKELRTNRQSWGELEKIARNGMIPTTPALKNYLRYGCNWSNPPLLHWLFGTIRKDERLRGKVAFSWAYRLENTDEWEIRGWMYLPQDKEGKVFRRDIINVFQENLSQTRNCLQALGLTATDYRTAQLNIFPTPNPWQPHSISEMQSFLSSIVHEETNHDQEY
ncbi:type III-B CRISPR module RAMP protein Cmr1 [Spirulina subsalsa]|uniref:type III-B CRISPR module RAMP protein Cmr1 n=1 Tax=Spirulina subsalsa TaxID=54311 RepID=UPI0002FF1FA8|nr:type III-B CRISPR module RAMP protein Cmr1 [Spirulina subsalsa]